MTTFTDNPAPATLLETLAARIEGVMFPVRIRGNDDRVALAAAALWTFARQTGLDRESETIQTVLTDFLADLLHLCERCSAEGEAQLQSAMQMATTLFEQERRGEEDVPGC